MPNQSINTGSDRRWGGVMVCSKNLRSGHIFACRAIFIAILAETVMVRETFVARLWFIISWDLFSFWMQLLYKSLEAMLVHESNVEDDFNCTFQIGYTDVFGSNLTHDLKENGGDIAVTDENKKVQLTNKSSIYDFDSVVVKCICEFVFISFALC